MNKLWDVISELQSTDTDVKKYIFKKDDAIAEAVLYKYGEYNTRTVLCISTQTGCQMGCSFCGTGKFFGRDLTYPEIVSQVNYALADNDIDPSKVESFQIMVMSMGEPVNNAIELRKAFDYFYEKYPKARLLISTSAPKTDIGWDTVMKMSEEIPTVGLQFSVHESTDAARNKLIPMKAKLSLNEIAERGLEFHRRTGRRPFFNYCVHDKNNTEQDAARLTTLFDPSVWEATLSVICESDQSMADAVQSQVDMVTEFSGKLLERSFNVRGFDPAGQDDIGGGCGQLWAVQEYAKSKPEHFKQSAGDKIRVRNV